MTTGGPLGLSTPGVASGAAAGTRGGRPKKFTSAALSTLHERTRQRQHVMSPEVVAVDDDDSVGSENIEVVVVG